MTRPGIVRADTLDLQDAGAPSAADHSKHPTPKVAVGDHTFARHQAAEVRNVLKERHSEEQHLQDAWNADGEDMMADSSSIDAQQDNANLNAAKDGNDGGESSDDDMLDRISSSPSIDDGASTPRSVSWPSRSSSFTPVRARLSHSGSSTPDSSPFVDAPAHFPLFEQDCGDFGMLDSTQQPSSPCDFHTQHLPLRRAKNLSASVRHHHMGEYSDEDSTRTRQPTGQATNENHEDNRSSSDSGEAWHSRMDQQRMLDAYAKAFAHTRTSSHSYGPQHSAQRMSAHSNEASDRAESHASQEDEDLSDLLLPDNDSLLESSLESTACHALSDDKATWLTTDPQHSGTDDDDYEDYDDDYDDEAFPYNSHERCIDSKWEDECLQDPEDIDFDFVYALHTFVATVEGQANATKGDTMVLLDDSNSYWWLVRVVKDSSIGYLPAEHIETPTERLARLNKHRNVDLSAAMLGDNAERSKNPLKKSKRRRNVKTVQFAAPTYVEASDYDYSTEEEDGPQEANRAVATNGQTTQKQQATIAEVSGDSAISNDTSVNPESPVSEMHVPLEEPQASPALVDHTEAAPLKSRKGTPRNADSFLKDENAETRKISLTPNILRDDSSSVRSGTLSASSSMDNLEKTASPTERTKEEKKKKEKKQGMLSGLFKGKKKEKKETKAKTQDSFVSDEDLRRASNDTSRAAPLPAGAAAAKKSMAQRRTGEGGSGKLQKPAPPELAAQTVRQAPAQTGPYFAELEGSQVAFEAPTGLEDNMAMAPKAEIPRRPAPARPSTEQNEFDDADRALADDDDLVDNTGNGTFMHGTEAVHIPMKLGHPQESSSDDEEADAEEEDDVEEVREGSSTPPSIIEMPQQEESEKQPPPSEFSESIAATDDTTPVPSKSQSPSPEFEDVAIIPSVSRTIPPDEPTVPSTAREPQRQDSKSSTMSSTSLLSPSQTSAVSQSWSDAGLRSWLDGNNDVRDMLVVIHDKSDVKPVPRDHPLMSGLFTEETKTLKGMQDQLDGLLGGFLQRRSGAAAVKA